MLDRQGNAGCIRHLPQVCLALLRETRSKSGLLSNQPNLDNLPLDPRAVHRRGIAMLPFSQSGSGKTRLVRSAQLRRIWRDAAHIGTSLPTEEIKEDDLEQHDGEGDL